MCGTYDSILSPSLPAYLPLPYPLLFLGNHATLDLTRYSPHHPGMDHRRILLTSLAGTFAATLAGEA